jgi:hypothetical protein
VISRISKTVTNVMVCFSNKYNHIKRIYLDAFIFLEAIKCKKMLVFHEMLFCLESIHRLYEYMFKNNNKYAYMCQVFHSKKINLKKNGKLQ